MADVLPLLLPVVVLALLLVAPRRGGRKAGPGARRAALFVLVWGALAIVIALAWNRFGWALLWNLSGDDK
ncbi:MAG TPA: hypothetical protein VEL28_18285 [Candidatus Binatia bacterium]|nr:hypothetical protein [Candidatus Binatia bacterium]